MGKRQIDFLLEYCNGKEKLFNAIGNELWVQFGIRSAEICLLCTYIADKMKGGNYDN